jgi:hypothetical protein
MVIARGTDVIQEMKGAGQPPDKVMLQGEKFLFLESFYKGVSNDTQMFDPVGADGTNWQYEFPKPFHGKMLYTINWTTGRYRQRLFNLDQSTDLPAAEGSGKCELIHPPPQ